MDQAYSSYGLQILADGEIPGLLRSHRGIEPDVRVSLNDLPEARLGSNRTRWYESTHLSRQNRPNLVVWRTGRDGGFHFVYDDGTEFLIESDGRHVWCKRPAGVTLADAGVYLRGPILSLVLRLRGVLCLHASAVTVGEVAIAILGSAGAGKSTTAAGLLLQGCSLLADDLTALDWTDGRFRVRPGYPRLNLWPDAGIALYGESTPLPRVAPADGVNDWWDKRYLEVESGRQFHGSRLPLAAVYVLGDRSDDHRAPSLEPLASQDAFLWLTQDTSANYAMDSSMRAAEFEAVSLLVRTTPVRMVTPHADKARLLDMCELVLRDVRS